MQDKYPRKIHISSRGGFLPSIISFVLLQVIISAQDELMQRDILFLNFEKEDTEKSINLSYPEPVDELSVFGWVKPNKDLDHSTQNDLLIVYVKKAYPELPTQEFVEDDLLLFSFVLN